ncbi:hypothetical protein VTO73DRAFT_9934 [Trametes versicolor]
MSSPTCALALANPKKRVLADSDTEQRDPKRTKPQDDPLENELKKETKDKKKRRKKKRKVPVVLAQDLAEADARVVPGASGSRSRSRSMTLAVTPAPDERLRELAALSSPCAGPSKTTSREASPSRSSSSKGKGKVRATPDYAVAQDRRQDSTGVEGQVSAKSNAVSRDPSPSDAGSNKGKGRATPDCASAQDSQERIADLEGQMSTKSNLVTQHETLLSSFQQSLSCQICLDLMHKPFALAPCGHSACHQCLVNWFKAPPPDVPAHDVLPVWLRKKTCPHCRTVIKDRPIEIWTIKDMVATLVKSGLAPAPLLPLAPPPEEGAANADPWSGIFRPANRNHDIFPDWQPPELMQQLLGMRDDEDGGIYRCVDCHHEIEDGACSQCGRVYPGHNPLDHHPDEFDDDVVGHWAAHEILDDSMDEDEDDDFVAADHGGGGGLARLPVEMIRQLFMLNGPGDADSDSLYTDESGDDAGLADEQLLADFVAAHPGHHAYIERVQHDDGDDEEGYESSFIDDDGNNEDRPRRRRAPSVDLDRDSVIDLSEADEEPAVDDGQDDEVQFVGFGRRRGGLAARGRAAIVITSEDEEDEDRFASEGGASDDDGDLAAEVAAREYDMYGDDGSVPRRGALYDDASDEDGEGFDDEYSS